MIDIFDNSVALDCFCYEIIEAWMKMREAKGKPLDKTVFMEWVYDDFALSLEYCFDDCIEEIER